MDLLVKRKHLQLYSTDCKTVDNASFLLPNALTVLTPGNYILRGTINVYM